MWAHGRNVNAAGMVGHHAWDKKMSCFTVHREFQATGIIVDRMLWNVLCYTHRRLMDGCLVRYAGSFCPWIIYWKIPLNHVSSYIAGENSHPSMIGAFSAAPSYLPYYIRTRINCSVSLTIPCPLPVARLLCMWEMTPDDTYARIIYFVYTIYIQYFLSAFHVFIFLSYSYIVQGLRSADG